MKQIKLKGWIARDKNKNSCPYAFYSHEPYLCDDGCYNNRVGTFTSKYNEEFVEKAGLKQGECRAVEIIIRETRECKRRK